MLCPECLGVVPGFNQLVGAHGSFGWVCPACSAAVPLRYERDYALFPPVVFSVIGFRGHGKTVFLASFLNQLEEAEIAWPNFSAAPLDEEGLETVREHQRSLETGQLPDSTDKTFIRPAMMRLENVPHQGNCHLLLYDSAGEAILRVTDLTEHYGYVSRVPVIVLLVSLKELKKSSDLVDFLTIYNQTVLGLRGDPRTQTLLVVLTQADRFVDEPGVPETVQRYLQVEDDLTVSFERLEVLSAALEEWLGGQRGLLTFVRRAKADFRQVRYCVLSATGSAPNGRELSVAAAPRGVMAPLIWVMRLSGVPTNPSNVEKIIARLKDWSRRKNRERAGGGGGSAPGRGHSNPSTASTGDTAMAAAFGIPWTWLFWSGLFFAVLGCTGVWPTLMALLSFACCLASLPSLVRSRNHKGTFAVLGVSVVGAGLVLRSIAVANVLDPAPISTTREPHSIAPSTAQAPEVPNRNAELALREARRGQALKIASIQEMLQTRQLSEQHLLGADGVASQERKIRTSLQTALSHVKRALDLDPRCELALAQRAAILYLLQRFAEAIDAADAGLKLYPDNADLREAKQKIAERMQKRA